MSLNKSGSITYTQKQFGCHLANNYTKVSGAYRGYSCPTVEAAPPTFSAPFFTA